MFKKLVAVFAVLALTQMAATASEKENEKGTKADKERIAVPTVSRPKPPIGF